MLEGGGSRLCPLAFFLDCFIFIGCGAVAVAAAGLYVLAPCVSRVLPAAVSMVAHSVALMRPRRRPSCCACSSTITCSPALIVRVLGAWRYFPRRTVDIDTAVNISPNGPPPDSTSCATMGPPSSSRMGDDRDWCRSVPVCGGGMFGCLV
jgi:hypothetical protein